MNKSLASTMFDEVLNGSPIPWEITKEGIFNYKGYGFLFDKSTNSKKKDPFFYIFTRSIDLAGETDEDIKYCIIEINSLYAVEETLHFTLPLDYVEYSFDITADELFNYRIQYPDCHNFSLEELQKFKLLYMDFLKAYNKS